MERIVLPSKYQRRMLDHFIAYAMIDTQSDEATLVSDYPTSGGQLVLADLLVSQLRKLGVSDARVSPFGYVYASLPENLPPDHPAKGRVPAIGLIAHLDTAGDQSGKGVRPQVHENYDGQDISYPDDPELVLKASDNPELLECRGMTVITAGGQTLLGADDKAGIAEIMAVVEYLTRKGVPHGEIRICFNPDEEVGGGMDHLDASKLPVRYAYTLDGGRVGEVEDECFNAASARITILGRNCHPGSAKGKMANAFRVFAWLTSRLPENELPETTEGREPFRHPHSCPSTPTVERFQVDLLLRAFTEAELDRMKSVLQDLCREAEGQFPGARVTVEFKDSYRNMRRIIDEHPLVMELLEEACRIQRVAVVHKPIRGGTDGSSLTIDRGIPTPNIWAGGMNMHSRLEWVPLEWMASAAATVLTLIGLWVEHGSETGQA
jgi:tripeptide aminopeptidase